MGCSTCGGKKASSPEAQATYVVTFRDGTTKEVVGEHAAKVEVTLKGGGSYAKR